MSVLACLYTRWLTAWIDSIAPQRPFAKDGGRTPHPGCPRRDAMTTTTRFAAFTLALCLAPCCLLTTGNRASASDCLFCPITVFSRPKTPCVFYKRVCPKKICPCCGLDNYGYYPTCWQAWPFPPNYAHCPTPRIVPSPYSPTEEIKAPEQLPEKPIEKQPEKLPAPKTTPKPMLP
jgi:hypothetical protein